MNLDSLRLIDKYIGQIICRLLIIVSKLTRSKSITDRTKNHDYKEILIVKFFGMGSILLMSPAIIALRNQFPNSKITILTLSENIEICQMLKIFDGIVTLSISNLRVFAVGFFRFLRESRNKKYDVIMDLEFLTNFSAMVVQLLAIIVKPHKTIGFSSPLSWRNHVHDLNVSFDHTAHVSRIFMKFVRSIFPSGIIYNNGTIFESIKVNLLDCADYTFTSNENIDKALFNGANPTICININSGSLNLNRRWPIEYYRDLTEKILELGNVTVIMVGGPGDSEYVNMFLDKIQNQENIVDLTGKLSLRQLIALFSKVDGLISNDSGPLHLAYIVGLFTISFFGPETPNLYGPLGDEHHVFYTDLYCSPCLNIYNSKLVDCTSNICLRDIKPEDVFSVINEKLLMDSSNIVKTQSS